MTNAINNYYKNDAHLMSGTSKKTHKEFNLIAVLTVLMGALIIAGIIVWSTYFTKVQEYNAQQSQQQVEQIEQFIKELK